jgi:murein DD-endopeptidase MepM/ murein hydrolase activator NlpD
MIKKKDWWPKVWYANFKKYWWVVIILAIIIAFSLPLPAGEKFKMIRPFDDVTYKPLITGKFGSLRPTEGGIGKTHTGIDYKLGKGIHLLAAQDGIVEFVGDSESGYGWLVIINHGNGIKTYYAHVSKQWVLEGQSVKQGQHIADVGSNGHSTGYHVHFEVRQNGIPVHPAKFIL